MFVNTATLVAEIEQAAQPWWHVFVQEALGLTILFVFLVAVVGLIINQRKRDKCLKLLDGYHVSYQNQSGHVLWGDLIVLSKELELVYDKPYKSRNGLYKSSSLIYESDIAKCVAICRTENSLTKEEKLKRLKQITQTFSPNIYRRSSRWFRNILNTLKDAFGKAFSLLLGQFMKAQPGNAITQQQQGIDQIGQMMLGAAGNAYEPILERHIGRPVVLQYKLPFPAAEKTLELPGYLADYSEKYIAIFNRDHKICEEEKLQITEDLISDWYDIKKFEQTITVTCKGSDFLYLKYMSKGKEVLDIGVTLLPGARVELVHDGCDNIMLNVCRTKYADMVCPRTLASVYFGGEKEAAHDSRDKGIAPEKAAQRLAGESDKN